MKKTVFHQYENIHSACAWLSICYKFFPFFDTSFLCILLTTFLTSLSRLSLDNALLSDLVTHGVSILLLALLNCSNTVLVRGVYIDAEEPDGQCVIFPVYYIRLFFQKERLKKQKRMLDSERGCAPTNCHHQQSLRQQLLRHNEKSPTILPMNKLSSSHLNLPHSISNSKGHGPVSPEEEWRSIRHQSKDGGGREEEASVAEATNNNTNAEC